MKIRSGFVSNSSSSSFVFALPKGFTKKCPTCGHTNDPEDVSNIFESDYEGISLEFKGGLKEFFRYVKDYDGLTQKQIEDGEEKYYTDIYNQIKKLEETHVIYSFDVGYSCSGFFEYCSELNGFIDFGGY